MDRSPRTCSVTQRELVVDRNKSAKERNIYLVFMMGVLLLLLVLGNAHGDLTGAASRGSSSRPPYLEQPWCSCSRGFGGISRPRLSMIRLVSLHRRGRSRGNHDEICFRLAKKRFLARSAGDAGMNAATFDADAYRGWRWKELEGSVSRQLRRRRGGGKDVSISAVAKEDLSYIVSSMAPKSITGIDVDSDRVASANNRLDELKPEVVPTFKAATTMDTIDMPDASVDLLLCFDVLEHIIDYEAILPEWSRVLRPGARVMIWWVPWFHPYGHHIESLVPLPWAHAIFSDKALIDTCARIYDLDEFKPRIWDLDEDGNKKPNKWRGMDELPDVNKLTMSRFENICRKIGLQIDRRELHGFAVSGVGKVTHAFKHVPLLREYFTAYTVYELVKS